MNFSDHLNRDGVHRLGREMYDLIAELFPICRSITGDGTRQTLEIMKRIISIDVFNVPSGTRVFDWSVPKEWNIRDAYVKNARGERVIDFKKSNLHVLNYSIPISRNISFAELQEHLYSLPDHPDWIPYRTSYYNENWGFCLSDNSRQALAEEEYEVFIDSSLKNGELTYGEYYLKGLTEDEILLTCHICHPSLCNDNLSGISLVVYLAKLLTTMSTRFSYRFLFIPGTIGSITWLALNEEKLSKIKAGLVVAGVGDSGPFTYKRSRIGDAEIDRIVECVLACSNKEYKIIDFFPYGYDERQFCSPGFNLPVGSLTRTPYGDYPEYHTSADNLDFVNAENLSESFAMYADVIFALEHNEVYLNQNPKCEPQLGKRGLYSELGGNLNAKDLQLAMLWVLNMSDGKHSLLDIAAKAKLDFKIIHQAVERLEGAQLLRRLESIESTL
jgi:aminopeptidase-like protein